MVPHAVNHKDSHMIQPKNNQEFYEALDETCGLLRAVGMDVEADTISHRLHKVPWNSTSELFEELEVVLRGVLAGANAVKLTPQLKDQLYGYLRILATI